MALRYKVVPAGYNEDLPEEWQTDFPNDDSFADNLNRLSRNLGWCFVQAITYDGQLYFIFNTSKGQEDDPR